MRVVVAGGRGFIGGAAMRALAAAGHDAVAIGRGEIADGDVFVWAAGGREPDLPRNRMVHVEAAARAARASGASRVIYLSTGEIYGDAPLPFRETGPTRARSAYGRAKLEGELGVALRIGVAYGPGQDGPMLLPSVARALAANQRIALTAGDNTRDFVYVDDVAAAIVAALAAPEGPINIATGIETRVRDAVELLASHFPPGDLLDFGARPPRSDEPRRYVLDVSRARDLLGWQATTPLAAGLAATSSRYRPTSRDPDR